MSATALGRLIVVSGPSGAGKTTVLRRVYQQSPLPLVPSVSATTRPPRPDEKNGVDYHFLPQEEFDSRQKNGDFLECFEVFGRGYWYGTLAEEVTTGLEAGKWVVLEIDVQGALDVMRQYPDAVTIFICPSTIDELRRRLHGRGTETDEAIGRRLARAEQELALADRYRYQVINDDIDQAVEHICKILVKESEAKLDD